MNLEQFEEKLKKYVQANEQDLIQSLAWLVAQPSVSSTGEGVLDCCEMLMNRMKEMGLEVEQAPVEPHPAIIGRWGHDPSKKTVMIYAHYDVQPQGELELWRTPPFEPVIKDGVMYGRGTADNKGPLMAHLNAIDFWLKEYGDLPVNLLLIFEGSEESNSEGLPEYLR